MSCLKSQYEVIYRVKMFPDTLLKINVIEEDLSLLIKGNKSLFKSTKKALRDSKPIILLKDVASTKYITFHKARQNYLDNPAGTFSSQTGFTVKPSDIARINGNVKRFNNYID